MVRKSKRILQLIHGGRPFKTYAVALGPVPEGPKRKAGDGRTPEGVYTLDWRNPRSNFYRSIHVSYPAPHDEEPARRWGVRPGGLIMIHGLPNGVPRSASVTLEQLDQRLHRGDQSRDGRDLVTGRGRYHDHHLSLSAAQEWMVLRPAELAE